MNFIYDLHSRMINRNLILVYHGEFTQETTKSILSMAERSLQASQEDAAVKRKVFNVMVESLQNIVKHRSEEHTSELQSLLRHTYDRLCLKPKKKFNNTN